jgi:hypothetical protein
MSFKSVRYQPNDVFKNLQKKGPAYTAMSDGYLDNSIKIDARKKDINEIKGIMNDLVFNDLKCVKYNYALDDVVQNFSSY